MWDFPRNDVLPGLIYYDVCGLNFFSSKTGVLPSYLQLSSTATATETVIPTMGERADCRRWRKKGGERVAAVGKKQACFSSEVSAGNRNRGSNALLCDSDLQPALAGCYLRAVPHHRRCGQRRTKAPLCKGGCHRTAVTGGLSLRVQPLRHGLTPCHLPLHRGGFRCSRTGHS